MKTKLSYFICFIFLSVIALGNVYSQNLFNPSSELTTFNDSYMFSENVSFSDNLERINSFSSMLENHDDYELEVHDPQELVRFASAMFAAGAGLGFGNDQTLWCLHAAYYMRLALYSKSAFYGSLGAVYDGLSADNFNRSLIDIQLKLLMFHAITQYSQVHFIYGVMLAYGFGNEKFDAGPNYDVTRLTAALVLGVSLVLTTQLAIMIQTNILTHQRWTQKYNGSECKNNTTIGNINKHSLLLLSLVWTLSNPNR